MASADPSAPALGDWSLLPEDLEHLLGLIDAREVREVVELGSGAGTVVLARGLARRGGRLTSVEHDADWARHVREMIAGEELAGVARVVQAPLGPHPLADPGSVWYSQRALHALPEDIGMLIVDGPPGNLPGMEMGRAPALEALGPRLGPGALVVLDDVHRPGERAIIERWEERTAFRFHAREGGRIAVGSAA